MDRIEITRIEARRNPKVELDDHFFVITLSDVAIRVEAYRSVRNERGGVVTGRPVAVVESPDAVAIVQTLIREGLVGSRSHAAYLGRELTIAQLALEEGSDYEQDEFDDKRSG